MSGGKGGSTSTSGSSYSAGTSTTQLPDWVTNASQGALQAAENYAAQPYQAYTGQLVADVPQATQQAYQEVGAMQGMGMGAYGQDIGAYSGLLGQVNPLSAGQVNQLSNQLYGNYGQNVVAPTAGILGNYLQSASPATAQQVGSNAMQLMGPYEQAVINPTLKLAQQQLAENLQTVGAGANQANAFGGARQGVMEGVAQAQSVLGTEGTISNLLNTGYQSALGIGNQLATNASQQGYGAANTLAGLLGTGYNQAQQQAQGLAGTNLQAGLTAAGQLPGALTAQQTAAQQQASLLQTVGAAQQQQAQSELDAQYGQWQAAQDWPIQGLDTVLSALGTIPYGDTTSYAGYNYGSQKATNTPSIGSTLSSTLGGAAAGSTIGQALGIGSGWGAAAGGILGAL